MVKIGPAAQRILGVYPHLYFWTIYDATAYDATATKNRVTVSRFSIVPTSRTPHK
jgi:hypothetical protein